MKRGQIYFPALALLLMLATRAAAADTSPLFHPLFQNHAVLQRDRPIPVWGWAAPGDEVAVSLAGASVTTHADASGRWRASLPAMSAGGPLELTARAASGASESVHDVLIGDVWLCSGQSNMVLQVRRTNNSRVEMQDAANDSIRMLTVPLASSFTPLATFSGPVAWQPTTPATIPEFSATCYYFARELQKGVPVPMGLVNSSFGGANIQTWMSETGLRAIPRHDELLDLLNKFTRDPKAANQRWGEMWESWWRERHPAKPGFEPWSATRFNATEWQVAPAPLRFWEDWDVPALANFNGLVWYRTTIALSARQASQAATLSLGTIDDTDETWVNGRAVGYTASASAERSYELAPGLLRKGENVIVINVLDAYQSGGIYGPAARRALRLADGSSIPLAGPWYYQIVAPFAGPPPRAPWEPVRGITTIHNAMIAPLTPYGLRGVVWYQGESNTEDAARYQAMLAGLMADWRREFETELPFLIVQLPNYGPATTAPNASEWAALREAQRLAVLTDAHAGLAVAIDVGDPYDLHPGNKQEVGRRLARAALHVVYGAAIAPSGPVALEAKRDGERVVVTFGDIEDRLIVHGAARPIGFELCGVEQASCRYVDATADARQVWLDARGADSPTRVRYCWADSPICTLFDRAGLPAGPFELAIR